VSRPTVADGSAPGHFGVYPALVTKLVPDASEKPQPMPGQVQVKFPWLGQDADSAVRAWATLCSPYADDQQGLEILPEVGSEVVVAFEGGNLRRPYIIGAAWHGKAQLPHKAEQANNIRVLQSRAKSKLEFDDTQGSPKVTVSTPGGHSVVLDDGSMEITVTHSMGCTITLTATSIKLDANVSVEVTAPMVEVQAPISTFSGIVQGQTFIAESFVVSPGYTPGVGNLL